MLVRLVYASRSAAPITSDMVNDILAHSHKHNPDAGITGVLCVCHGDVFMQALEGGREEVNRLYGKLLRDPRHNDVVLLDYAEIVERQFSNWRMGRVDFDKLNAGVILRYCERTTLDPYKISGKVAMAVLEELMSTASIVA